MREMETRMDRQTPSILVVTRNPDFDRMVREAFPAGSGTRVTTEDSSFGSLNGHAADLALRHGIVLFDADPGDETEVRALAEVLDRRSKPVTFLAFVDDNASVGQARRLRDIGVDDVLPLSTDGSGLRDLVHAMATPARKASSGPAADAGLVIAVAQARGGVGATTYAANLAIQFMGQGGLFRRKTSRKVALVDLDLQFGDIGVYLDLEDNGALVRLLAENAPPDVTSISALAQRHASGLDVIVAPSRPVPIDAMSRAFAAGLIETLRTTHEVVVVDLPHVLVDWLSGVLSLANRLHIVTDTSVPCIRQCRRLMDLFLEEQIGLPVEIIVNREKKPLMRSEHIRQAEQVLGTRITHWIPDNADVARRAVDLGRPASMLSPSCDVSRSIQKIAVATFVEGKPTTRPNA